MVTETVNKEMQTALLGVLAAGISDDTMKAVKKSVDAIMCDIEGDLQYRLKDELAPHLMAWTVEMANSAVMQLLAGNEDQMCRYLSCEKRGEAGYICWTGRSDSPQYGRRREMHEWHPVIHGTLFEQGAVALRKAIVEAHRDLLVNERIKDLEDQVSALVAQVNKARAEADRQVRHHYETDKGERDALYGYVSGLLGLLQLVRGRDDISEEAREAMRTNHRATDAAAYLTQIVPPKEA